MTMTEKCSAKMVLREVSSAEAHEAGVASDSPSAKGARVLLGLKLRLFLEESRRFA
jgi:hypothetical protein